jgi:hypothetical protein
MSYLTCDEAVPDDEIDGMLPLPRPIGNGDYLTPKPPPDWIIVLHLFSDGQDTRGIGAWIVCMREAEPNPDGYMIVRDAAGTRVLVVRPGLQWQFRALIEAMNETFESCNCGGGECIAGPEQDRAARTFARRKWRSLPFGERVALAEHVDADPALALDDDLPITGTCQDDLADLTYMILHESF